MSVGELCNRAVAVTGPDTSVAEAARLMRRHHVGDLVILDDTEIRAPVGLVTDRDLVIEVMAQDLDPENVTVEDIMTRELAVVAEDMDFWEAVHEMRRRGVRRLPVVNEGGGLEGILTLDDALELVVEALTGLTGLVTRELERESDTRR